MGVLVTSERSGLRLKKNIGYAMLPVAHVSLGKSLIVDVPGTGERQATVVPKPFVDRDKAIPRS